MRRAIAGALSVYLRDLASGRILVHGPSTDASVRRDYEAIFSQGRAEFRMRHNDIDSHTEITVSPEDDIEVRRVTLTNHSSEARTIELTSFAEVALTTAGGGPGASRLQQSVCPDPNSPRASRHCLLAPRAGPRRATALDVSSHARSKATKRATTSFETDRAQFLGRGRTAPRRRLWNPRLLVQHARAPSWIPPWRIRRTSGSRQIKPPVSPSSSGSAGTRERPSAWWKSIRTNRIADRVFELAWTHGLVTLRHLNATEPEAQLFGRLAGALLYSQQCRRAPSAVLLQNRRGQRNLWSLGISGDLPIVLLRFANAERVDLCARCSGPRLLAAERFGRRSGHSQRGRFRLSAIAS